MRSMENRTLGCWTESVEPFLDPLVRVGREFTDLTGVPVDVPAALFLRAEAAGFAAPGRTSANGSCRLMEAADGWVALNLARPDDIAAIPALLALMAAAGASGTHPETTAGLAEAARSVPAAEAAGAAQLLGVAASALGSARHGLPAVRTERLGEARSRGLAGLRVVDLSALWAGPLCARLLGLAGAEVVKVESTTRPDGARLGSPDFYRWLHDGHENRVLDFGSGALADIVAEADIVIEASRPRALRRLGVHAEQFLAARPGRVWLSITGYGRDDDRIAFGDDAAAAAGLVDHDADGRPLFLGDAIADPVTGIHAARAVARSVARGGGELVAAAMAGCAAELAAHGRGPVERVDGTEACDAGRRSP